MFFKSIVWDELGISSVEVCHTVSVLFSSLFKGLVYLDPLLLVLGLTQTCFEGSMYLFVFLWVPSLQESHESSTPLPLGYIFSSFMISMMLGSLLYTAIVSSSQQKTVNCVGGDSSLALHAKLSSMICAASACSLALSVASTDERIRFYAFCLFEACVGMYYPVQGTLRGTLISNEHRATVSWLFSTLIYIPSPNIFVAFIAFPCSTQYLRRRRSSHRCFYGT